MLLQGKIDRAMKWAKERRMRADGLDPEEEEIKEELRKHSSKRSERLPSAEELREEAREDMTLEKGDLPAMLISAMITIFPVCVVVILVICLLAYLFMVH